MANESYFFKNKKQETKNKKQNTAKKGLVKVIAVVLSGFIILSSGIIYIVHYFKNKKNNTPVLPQDSIIQLDDLGEEITVPQEDKKDYGNTTGNINKDKLVEKDGKIYDDQDSADKSDNKGTVSTNTKDNKLEVDANGKVHEKEDGYEIKDKEGNIVQSGDKKEDGSIEDYEKNEELGGTYEENDDTSNLVRADADYYNEEGICIIYKGQLITKEALSFAKENLSTISIETSSIVVSSNINSSNVSSMVVSNDVTSSDAVSSNISSTSNDSELNKDGMYTIFGLTFESKADYQQWILQGYQGYAEVDGIMKSEEEIKKQLVK